MCLENFNMEVTRRRSALDVIDDVLKIFDIKSFALRIVYVGEHDFGHNDKILQNTFDTIVENINSSYCDVPVKGVLVVCPKHFFVILEGSEDTTMRHVNTVLNLEGLQLNIRRLKLLAIFHNVKKLIFTTWNTIYMNPTDKPMELIEDTPEAHLKVFKLCLKKLRHAYSIEESDIDEDDFPDSVLTDFILSSPYILDLEDYASTYLTLPAYTYSFENSWPAPFDFTPSLDLVETPSSTFMELLSNIDDFKSEDEADNDEDEDYGEILALGESCEEYEDDDILNSNYEDEDRISNYQDEYDDDLAEDITTVIKSPKQYESILQDEDNFFTYLNNKIIDTDAESRTDISLVSSDDFMEPKLTTATYSGEDELSDGSEYEHI